MVTVADLIKDLSVAIPAISTATMTITSAINGRFSVENPNIKRTISWVVAVLCGIGFVAFNGLEFGLQTWQNYLLGGLCGLCAGAMANGIFDWPFVKSIFNGLSALCTPKSKRIDSAETPEIAKGEESTEVTEAVESTEEEVK